MKGKGGRSEGGGDRLYCVIILVVNMLWAAESGVKMFDLMLNPCFGTFSSKTSMGS